ncbi:MAG TPA: hypothetical protein PK867_31280, partial [Pirellulales bacterium]|nr:hypothetical protein [Pirellulales bacterium]
MNRPPRLPYNARMPSRPQFSLRMLLFVMAMVCLAAATIAPLRPPPRPLPPMLPGGGGGGGGWEWEDLGFAIHAQAWLRLAACVVFPAVVVASAVARGAYTRTFCLGALLPAAIPLVLVSLDFSVANDIELIDGRVAEEAIQDLGKESYGLAERITTLWACIPCMGLTGVLARWLLRMPKEWK